MTDREDISRLYKDGKQIGVAVEPDGECVGVYTSDDPDESDMLVLETPTEWVLRQMSFEVAEAVPVGEEPYDTVMVFDASQTSASEIEEYAHD